MKTQFSNSAVHGPRSVLFILACGVKLAHVISQYIKVKGFNFRLKLLKIITSKFPALCIPPAAVLVQEVV